MVPVQIQKVFAKSDHECTGMGSTNVRSEVKTIRFVALVSVLSALFDLNISAQQTTTPSASSSFIATVANPSLAPKPGPEGMVWIPGGEFSMGSRLNGEGSCGMRMASNDTEPVHRVRVDGFWMDATTVTNDQFEKFVKATRYATIAERAPTKEELPDAPPENLVAGATMAQPEVSLAPWP